MASSPLLAAPKHAPAPFKSINKASRLLLERRSCIAPARSDSVGAWHSRRAAAAHLCLVRASGADDAASSAEAAASASQELEAIRQAARLVADQFVDDGRTLGLGTGLAVNALIEELAARLDSGQLRSITIIPASDVTASEAAFHGLPLTTLEAGGPVYLMVEVADELALAADGSPAFIIGRQQAPLQQPQPQLPRARALAAAAARVVVIAEGEESVVDRLGGALPVVIDAEDWEDTAEELDDIFLGDAEVWRRSTQPNAGPRGGESPYVSPEGENILDIRFDAGLKLFGEDADYAAIAREIESVPGVVAHGLVVPFVAAAVIASPDEPRLVQKGSAAAA